MASTNAQAVMTATPGAIDLAPGVSLPPEIVTATVAVLANRGGGKSAVTHRLVELMHTAALPVVVLDVKGDWWGIRSSADGKGAGLPFVIFGGDHEDVPLEPTAGQLLADLIVDDRIPAVLDLSHMSKSQARTFATTFAERLYHRNRDPLHVVIEEADVLIPQRASADTARLLGAMEDLAKRGRHRGLGMTVVSQRPQETAKSVLELMETVILLRMTGPRSIKAVQDWISVNADHDDTTARQVIASLPSLATGEGWVWSPGFLRILERTTFPMFSTFDSHATPKPGQTRVVPKKRADIDLEKLGAEIAATRERAQHNDPHALRTEIQSLQRQLAAATQRADQAAQHMSASSELLAQRESENAALRAQLTDLQARLQDDPQVVKSLRSASDLINSALHTLTTPASPSTPQDATPPATPAHHTRLRPTPAASALTTGETCSPADPSQPREPHPDAPPRFRSGAQRMITALARMAPFDSPRPNGPPSPG
ncbi:AAA-like domain protein [Mycobacterium kansasii]|uniref:AAA-like domain protein n=1 Tax=Mycobacterium kansasii TaxID=1768 RepID=A0A1V3WEF7_MYCKA|nr:AAA-like domain protein [Mycobacterium kansasii]